jgi:hypothetical protein
MSRGSVKQDLQVIASGDFLTIQPPVGEEWTLHTIYSAGVSELYFTDGTNLILAESLVGVGGYVPNLTYRATHDLYFMLKNTDTVSRALAYSAIQTADSSVMRVGSAVGEMTVLAEGDSLVAGPGSGHEWEIQNIFFDSGVRISLVHEADILAIATTAGAGVWRNVGFEIVSSDSGFILQVINDNATNAIVAYTGVVTRIP